MYKILHQTACLHCSYTAHTRTAHQQQNALQTVHSLSYTLRIMHYSHGKRWVISRLVFVVTYLIVILKLILCYF
jgi:maltodextrin utilization protein YvdJ